MTSTAWFFQTESLHNLKLHCVGDARTVHIKPVLGLVAKREPLTLLNLLLIILPLVGNNCTATHTANRDDHGRTFLLDVWGESIFPNDRGQRGLRCG